MCKSIFVVVIGLIFSIPFSFAYIDPGTGGYLIQSLWAWIVGAAAFVVAITAHFFRIVLSAWAKRVWAKSKVVSILLVALVLIAISLAVLSLIPKTVYVNPHFDPALSGVHWYDESQSAGGYNLYQGKLIDMDGNLIHEWEKAVHLGTLDTNGDYYAQTRMLSSKWGRYTWNDTIVWEKNYPIHHEILLTPWDTIYTFTKEMHKYNNRLVEWDVIIELDKNGTILDRWSTWDNLEYLQNFHGKLELDKPWGASVKEDTWKNTSIWGANYDYYHLNSMSLVPNTTLQGEHPAFEPGNWLISMRHGSMLFILDKDTKEVLWRAIYNQIDKGQLEGQHTPHMLADGTILVFDNGRGRGWSRVLEIDPLTLKVKWEYGTADPDTFFTYAQGQVKQLENNNMQVVESESGRVFELTKDREIVWEFYHPEEQNELNSFDETAWGTRQHMYRMTRYSTEFIDNILQT